MPSDAPLRAAMSDLGGWAGRRGAGGVDDGNLIGMLVKRRPIGAGGPGLLPCRITWWTSSGKGGAAVVVALARRARRGAAQAGWIGLAGRAHLSNPPHLLGEEVADFPLLPKLLTAQWDGAGLAR